MLYQKILTGDEPYFIALGACREFLEHRHADIEICYCVKGRLKIIIDKKAYTLEVGDMVLVNPMAPHEILSADGERLVLTAMVGSAFLKKNFVPFTRARASAVIFKLGERGSYYGELRALLDETVSLLGAPSYKNDLLRKGNLYKICHYLGEAVSEEEKALDEANDWRRVSNIEKALDLIYYAYPKPLTVEDAATATGYGKSNFCKIFKTIVGKSFHRVLNEQRVKNACQLLLETDMSISAVATEVGFGETKTFCRVFKAVTGKTPGAYRKSKGA